MTRRKQPTQELFPPPALVTFPFTCQNCDGHITTALVFCSALCRQEADFVRYHRACIDDGRFARPDVKQALRIRLAILVGGGYPEGERRVPAPVRDQVVARDQDRCCECGATGTQIDHINGNSGELANLQLLCAACHNQKTMERFVTITPESHPEECARHDRLLLRVWATKPARTCDATEWKDQSRKIRSARSKIMGQATQRRSGKKCPVCLAPLKKTPRSDYLQTKSKRLNHCIACHATPTGKTCAHCQENKVWENASSAACQSCGREWRHRT